MTTITISNKAPEDANKPAQNTTDEGERLHLQGIREGWIIPASKPGVGLPPPDVTFTSDLTIEEVLREVRGT